MVAPDSGDVIITEAVPEDVEEILALQKSAFRGEAVIYGEFGIPPLTQTLAEIEAEFSQRLFLKAVTDDRIVGSARAHMDGDACHIGRVVVLPDYQGRGIGTRLMGEIESRFPEARRYVVFTGHLSERNLYLYAKLGYRAFRREPMSDRLTMIFLAKIRRAE